jgi:hypothetical protein
MAGGNDEANVLHTGCVLGKHVFELDTLVIHQSPNSHSTIITAADDVRTQCILAQRTYQSHISPNIRVLTKTNL